MNFADKALNFLLDRWGFTQYRVVRNNNRTFVFVQNHMSFLEMGRYLRANGFRVESFPHLNVLKVD